MNELQRDEIGDIYEVATWGAGYFEIGPRGTLLVRPGRVYCKVRQTGASVEFLDIGGGMGVDYDGSKSMFEAAMNYTMQEFANNVVYMIRTVCDDETVPHSYYLAMFLVRAYQEVMGSCHNLLGQTNEAQVVIDNDGRFHVTKIVPGSQVSDMLAFARYDPAQLQDRFARRLNLQVESGALTRATAERLAAEYVAAAKQQTYLD